MDGQSYQLDGARSIAVHALSDGSGPAELVWLKRVGRDLVERDDGDPPGKRAQKECQFKVHLRDASGARGGIAAKNIHEDSARLPATLDKKRLP